jgi:hypothetical protein
MSLRAVLNAKVKNTSGVLNPVAVTLKNQIQDIRSIEDIADVSEINVTDGATLVYNAATDKYEVKILDTGDINTENLNLDGGTF